MFKNKGIDHPFKMLLTVWMLSLCLPAAATSVLMAEELLDSGALPAGRGKVALQDDPVAAIPVVEEASPGDLWDRVRAGLSFHRLDNARIAAERRWYVDNPDYLARVTERATPYLYHVVEQLEQRGMPMELALLPIMESAYDPFAYSHGRAAGMWQIIPGTARELGLAQDWWYDGRRDVRASTKAALDYLERLGRRFDGDWLKALAAYNGGPARVARAERRNRSIGRDTDFWALELPRETRSYVPRLLALADMVAFPRKYGQRLTPIPDWPWLAVVHTGGQIDLAQAAKLAAMDIDRLYRINPGFSRWATSPAGPHELLLPAAKAALFRANLAALDPAQRIRWTRHRVRSGDTLSEIADRYNTAPAVIREVNKLRGNRIIAGKDLMIPIASAPAGAYSLSAGQRQAARQGAGEGYRVDYEVRAGDSFWIIARKFGVSTRKLAEWNGLAVRDPIRPGQMLVIWSDEPVSEVALTRVAFELPEREPMVRKIGYRVRSGDSLARIASKFKVSVEDILSWNAALRESKYIHPGQRLTLFVDVTRS